MFKVSGFIFINTFYFLHFTKKILITHEQRLGA